MSTDDEKNLTDKERAREEIFEKGRYLVQLSEMRDTDWTTQVYDWLYEFDNGALTVDDKGYPSLTEKNLLPAMYALKILSLEKTADFLNTQFEMLHILHGRGMQTVPTMIRELAVFGRDYTVEFVGACMTTLVRRGLVRNWDPVTYIRR